MRIRIAVTGAGGPCAVAFLEAVAAPSVDLFAGDIDPYAAGLYLVHPDNRWILRRGADPCFVDDLLARCIEAQINVLVPTVDVELLPLALRRAEFEAVGVRVLLANARTLEICLDKAVLVRECAGVCPVPRSEVLDEHTDLAAWPLPFMVKPRRGAGGRGVQCIERPDAIALLPRDGSLLVQEILNGREFSVDVLCTPESEALAVVPRSRLKIDSGIAVTGSTVVDPRLDASARAVVKAIGITYVANLQFREDDAGVPKLIDVNARFPGTMPLTIAAGVNMPRLAVDLVLGRTMPEDVGAYRPLGMVRVWRQHFIETAEIAQLESVALAQRTADETV